MQNFVHTLDVNQDVVEIDEDKDVPEILEDAISQCLKDRPGS